MSLFSYLVDDGPTVCHGRRPANDRPNNPYWDNPSEHTSYRVPSLDYGDMIMYFMYTSVYFLLLVVFMYIFIQKDIKRLI